MHHYHIEFPFGGLLQKLPKDRTPGDGLNKGRATFFAVDLDWFPASILAQLIEQALLGIE
jgi:hypothetical protein